MSFENDSAIVIKGARVHNLRSINITLPRDKLVVLTGPSGSGKSSLAFDTIYAEGQRRYVESLSAYARQFLEQVGKPEVDSITGLSPTISIQQRTTSYNPRSTVGTVTEIYDYLRLLYARIGKPFCWNCFKPIRAQSPQQVIDSVLSIGEDARVSILAPIVRERKGEYQKELQSLRQKGFVRVRIDGEVKDLSETIVLDKTRKHTIEVYVDRIVLKNLKSDRGAMIARVSESVELALKLASGLLVIEHDGKSQLISEKHACIDCEISYPDPEPRTFSFNSPIGACPKCDGLGVLTSDTEGEEEGEDEEPVQDGFVFKTPVAPPCPECFGYRLRKESLFFKINEKNIAELSALSVKDLSAFFAKLELTTREGRIASRVVKEISSRLEFLSQVGLPYLSLSRAAQTLSGGEAQRIRLATQIGSSLVGVIYVLDEPSIGLHQRDNDKLLSTLEHLRDLGNTVIVVEHDRDTMAKADWIVDLGPGAGVHGGEVIASGTYQELLKSKKSLTGKFLRGELEIAVPAQRRKTLPNRAISLKRCFQNNLKGVDASFPLGAFICVTGVSGSGKSTLVMDTLYPALARHLYRVPEMDLKLGGISGLDLIDKVVDIDQTPIGRTPRSNPSTYTGLFSLIRDLFSRLPDAQVRGYAPGRFSFNVKGGRCEVCQGGGVTKIEMHFLPDVFVMCESCKGKRYNRETLDILYKGKNICETLEMTVDEAVPFFEAIPQIYAKLKTLSSVGLGYIRLGQQANTLSGGESQRMKLSRELSKRSTGKTVYILDEPSTGLHFEDIQKLLGILQTLVDQGNTVVVIEHNLDIIKTADFLLDMGPEGGEGGGVIVASGTPEELAKNPASVTGKYLRPYLHS